MAPTTKPDTTALDQRVVESLTHPTTVRWEIRDVPVGEVVSDLPGCDLMAPRDAEGRWVGEAAALVAAAGLDPAVVGADEDAPTAAGAVQVWPAPVDGVRRLVVVGIGASTTDDTRTAAAAVGRRLRDSAGTLVIPALGGLSEPALDAALVEGVTLTAYRRPVWTADGPTRPAGEPLRAVLVGAVSERATTGAQVRARATLLARNLADTPANIKNPAWMAERARELADGSGLEITVWDEQALTLGGFGGLLAVGGGSATPPRFVRLDHRPAGSAGRSPIVLVGKGITFDTGGLDIKPADNMLSMKTDMLGSAVVLAVLAACRELAVDVPVTGLLCLAENAVSGSSYRPSDVIVHYGGRTSEVGNTDAEGRLVLADGLAYADTELDPQVVVDVATLTGAARVALARVMAPVYATDDALRDALVEAGERAGEPLWPFPLHQPYAEGMRSQVADLNHIADSTVSGAGSIVAALFLQAFVGQRRWAHLDIAGPGRSDVEEGVLGKGATAFSTRTLLTWLGEMS